MLDYMSIYATTACINSFRRLFAKTKTTIFHGQHGNDVVKEGCDRKNEIYGGDFYSFFFRRLWVGFLVVFIHRMRSYTFTWIARVRFIQKVCKTLTFLKEGRGTVLFSCVLVVYPIASLYSTVASSRLFVFALLSQFFHLLFPCLFRLRVTNLVSHTSQF